MPSGWGRCSVIDQGDYTYVQMRMSLSCTFKICVSMEIVLHIKANGYINFLEVINYVVGFQQNDLKF